MTPQPQTASPPGECLAYFLNGLAIIARDLQVSWSRTTSCVATGERKTVLLGLGCISSSTQRLLDGVQRHAIGSGAGHPRAVRLPNDVLEWLSL